MRFKKPKQHVSLKGVIKKLTSKYLCYNEPVHLEMM